MRFKSEESQQKITPGEALQLLKQGNQRFLNNQAENTGLIHEVESSAFAGQFPFAAVVSCMDSRIPAEHIFDQGLGDIFSIRVGGNVINEDVLGSLEFACSFAGAKLVVVMGHTNCGAVKSACLRINTGYLKPLLEKIQPAIDAEQMESGSKDQTDYVFRNNVSRRNVFLMLDEIRQQSKNLSELENKKSIQIVPAFYHLETGKVDFL